MTQTEIFEAHAEIRALEAMAKGERPMASGLNKLRCWNEIERLEALLAAR